MRNLFLLMCLMVLGCSANTTSFGADGTDTDDDTQAIQDAIDSGENVFIPAGTYYVSDSLVLQTHQSVMGDGINRTNIMFTGGSSKFAFVMNHAYQGIGKITIDCDDATDNRGNGLLFDGARYSHWEDVRIIRCADVGVKYTDSETTGTCRWNYGKGLLHIHSGDGTYPDGVTTCTGMLFEPSNNDFTNINHFDNVVINYCKHGVVVGNNYKSSQNGFNHLSVTGSNEYGIDIRKADAFVVNNGWLEDNDTYIKIADHPNVGSVHIKATMNNKIEDGGVEMSQMTNSRVVVLDGHVNTNVFGRFYASANFAKTTLVFATSITPDIKKGNIFYLEVGSGENQNITINQLTGIAKNQRFAFHIYNNSGGAMGDITWHGGYLTSWDNSTHKPANGQHTVVEFFYHGSGYGRSLQMGINGPFNH